MEKKRSVFLFHLCQWANMISALWVGYFWIKETPLTVIKSKTLKHFCNTSPSTEVYLWIFCWILIFLSFLLTAFSLLHCTLCVYLLWQRFDVDVPGNMVYKESRFTTAGNYLCPKISVLAEIDLLFLIYINFSSLVRKLLLYALNFTH
jgi:hypothetical protein